MSVTDVLSRISAIEAQIQSFAAPPTTSAAAFGDALAAAGTPTTSSGDLGTPTQYDDMIRQAAAEAGVSPALVKAVARAESGFDPHSGSAAGAQGLMQLMPATARGLGVSDPYDPLQSLRGGARYLRQMLDRFNGDVTKALAAYNAGPNAVARYGGIPPYAETQAYVPRVLGYFQEYGGGSATTAAAGDLAALNFTGARPLAPQGTGGKVATSGLQFLGTPYVWGGTTPAGFDCSGLAQYLYTNAGVPIPRTSEEQFKAGTPVATNQLRPGDLVFFRKNGDVHHVGIYLGSGRFLQAPHTGDVVKISSLTDPAYASEYCGARRYA